MPVVSLRQQCKGVNLLRKQPPMQLARIAVQKNRFSVLHLKLRFFASRHHRDAEACGDNGAVRGLAASRQYNAGNLSGRKPCHHRRRNICRDEDDRMAFQANFREFPPEDGTDQPCGYIVQVGGPLAEIFVINFGKLGGVNPKSTKHCRFQSIVLSNLPGNFLLQGMVVQNGVVNNHDVAAGIVSDSIEIVGRFRVKGTEAGHRILYRGDLPCFWSMEFPLFVGKNRPWRDNACGGQGYTTVDRMPGAFISSPSLQRSRGQPLFLLYHQNPKVTMIFPKRTEKHPPGRNA